MESSLTLVHIPDGGYGWVIAVCAFFNNVLVDGITYTFGVFVPHVTDHFHVTLFVIGWITSLQVGIVNSIGPVASLVGNRIGYRVLGSFGAIVAAVGMASSYFVQHYGLLFLTMGVIQGVGMGCLYLSGMVMVSTYFDEKRALATGIAVCGSGAGVLIFGQVVPALIDAYTWRGACLILGALFLNGCVSCAFLRPLPRNDDICTTYGSYEMPALMPRRTSETTANKTNVFDHVQRNQCNMPTVSQTQLMGGSAISALNTIPEDMAPEDLPNNIRKTFFPHNHICSVVNLDMYVPAPTRQKSMIDPGSTDQVFIGSLSSLAAVPMQFEDKAEGFIHLFCNFSIFKNPAIVLFMACNFFTMVGYLPPYTFTATKALKHNVPENKARLLLSIVGACSCISRVIFGFVASHPRMNKIILLICATGVAALNHILCIYCNNFWSLVLFSCVFGITMGIFIMLQTVVLCEMVKVPQNVPSALGMFLFVISPAMVISGPLGGEVVQKMTGDLHILQYLICCGLSSLSHAGLIMDSTKSYDILYIYCGACLFAAVLCSAPLPFIIGARRRKMLIESFSRAISDVTKYDKLEDMTQM